MDQGQGLAFTMRVNRVPVVIFCVVLLIGVETVSAVTVAKAHEGQDDRIELAGSPYCDFPDSVKKYNITDLLLCMNGLASTAVGNIGNARSSNLDRGRDLIFGRSRRAQYPYPQYQQLQYNYPPRPGGDYQSYYERQPSLYYPGSAAFQGGTSGYYDGGNKYPNTPQTPFALPGVTGAGLFDALTSISQYDDLKCVPRLLCEVATGVIPGNSGYKQSYDDFGGNSLISLLTALDIGGSSPLLTFGKSALTGYTSRGNPSVCYRQYPKCPRNNADLVNYLNNHNGGFFRFFGNNRGQSSQSPQGNYYRGALRREPTPPPGALRRQPAPPPGISGPEADRTGTGELKFDNSASLIRRDFAKSFFPEKAELSDSNKVVFPQEPLQEEGSLNRVSKSLKGYEETGSGYQFPFVFPQDRKDQEANMVYGLNTGVQTPQAQLPTHSSQTMESPKARLYLLDDPSNDSISSFTFPDGQEVQINVAFSKLFSDGYKKALRRSFANDHSPQPVDFEGFSMVNLAELFPNDRNLDLQVVHPCDMICHDSKGTPVQFNQILLHSNRLTTLMAPDQPILDLSSPLPCEVMCIDRRGERRSHSTTLNQVLSSGSERSNQHDFMDLQDSPESEENQRLIREHRRRILRNRDVNPRILQTRQFSVGKNANQPSLIRSTHKIQQQMPARENYNGRQFSSVRDRRSQPQTQLHVPKLRDTSKMENNANSANMNDNSAAMSEGSIMLGGGPMPFFGPLLPFMGMAGMSQGGPAFLPQGMPGPFGLGTPPMQSFGMMSMFPDMMSMMNPVPDEMASVVPVKLPPSIVCLDSTCASESQSPIRTLMLCDDVLYFIPYEFFANMPVCALCLENYDASTQKMISPISSPPIPSPPLTESYVTTVATTPKFRQPEGEDYPQLSCLEGQSWNLDVHECVPMKYDKDIETDYTHLPGSPWSKVTRRPIKSHRYKKRKKLVIINDKGNITYIKAA